MAYALCAIINHRSKVIGDVTTLPTAKDDITN
jgi:hypothetical protein